jgi:uncharacterized protein
MDLSEKVVVITGASSGLGKALALRLVREKCKLVLLSRSADKLQDVMLKIKEMNGLVSSFACNITDYNQVKNAVNYIIEAFGSIDVLINNAGILYEATTENYPVNTILELFDVNAIGAICMTQTVLPFMKKKNSGRIVNIISIAGVSPSASSGIYNATKYALQGFTESLKLELNNTDIKVMGFYPGGMEANLFTTQSLADDVGPFKTQKDAVADIIAYMMKQSDEIVMDHVEVRKIH